MLLDLAALPTRQAGEVCAIGVSVPGVVDPQRDRVSSTAFDWRRVALKELIASGLEQSGLDIRRPASIGHAKAVKANTGHPPITIASSRAAYVAAEAWSGAARGRQHVVGLLVGREITAGVMAGGRVLRGAGDLAGAAGWLALSEQFQREYARTGCLTTEANDAALVRRTIESWTSDVDSPLGRLTSADPAQLTPAAVIRAAQSGDALAIRVIAEACRRLGRATADLISLLNPEVVVIGGELGLALRPFLNDIRREARQWAQPDAARQCRIATGRYGIQKAALIGAARLAWLGVEATAPTD
jgi:glucokinase